MMARDLEELAQARIGETVAGKWTLEALLGVGGVGAVYRARHNNGNRVAVKIMHARFHHEKSMRERFLREARLGNRVDHPAVVRFHDEGVTDDGAPFLVADLLTGKNLEQLRIEAGGTLPLDDVIRIGSAVLAVLEIAHRANVVHRDLKPANVIQTDDGSIFMLDFGLAHAMEDTHTGGHSSPLTSADSMLGTVDFMAPEQAQGRWDLVGPQADLFATGATLFTLATGLDVHQADSIQGKLVLAATRPVPPTRTRAPGLPEPLCDALDRALAFSMKARFSNAREFRCALEGERLPWPLAPISGPGQPASWRPSSAALIALVALLAFGVTAAVLVMKQTRPPETDAAEWTEPSSLPPSASGSASFAQSATTPLPQRSAEPRASARAPSRTAPNRKTSPGTPDPLDKRH